MTARQRLDDLAGVAGGAFSLLSGLRAEMEAMARAQAEALVRRLELARAADLDAAMEVARRAREQAEALEARLAALEAEVAALKAESSAPEG
ncbi:MAG: accessory factor UbiK family protein [Roseococcus sp.]|jgi:BMFP domain-containing protein YqiC